MNRSAIVLIVVLVAIIAVFKFCNNKPEPQADDQRQAPLSVGQNTGSFNASFGRLLSAYYTLKDAFVVSDTLKIDSAAGTVRLAADSLRVNEIKGDSTGTIREMAQSFSTSIGSSAVAIAGEKDLEAKRRELNIISDALWSLTRTVKYDGEKVYYQFCPMAFNHQGGYWLSDKEDIQNPYLGDKMSTCGETADSVDYSKR